MREELQLQIAEKFDFMKRKPLKNPKIVDDLYGAFGIDTGDGWYQLIYDLCEEIAETFNKAGKPVNIVMDQVKEKWGTLRFYYHFEGEKHRLHAFDSIGGGGVRLTPKGDELHSQVSNIVRKYEEKSNRV